MLYKDVSNIIVNSYPNGRSFNNAPQHLCIQHNETQQTPNIHTTHKATQSIQQSDRQHGIHNSTNGSL